MCLVKWLNSSCSNLKKTFQYSSIQYRGSAFFPWKELGILCLLPFPKKDEGPEVQLLAYARHFPQQCLLV